MTFRFSLIISVCRSNPLLQIRDYRFTKPTVSVSNTKAVCAPTFLPSFNEVTLGTSAEPEVFDQSEETVGDER